MKKKKNDKKKASFKREKQAQLWYLPKDIVLEEINSRRYLLMLTAMISLIVIMIVIWAALTSVDEKTVTKGEIVPIDKVNVVEHLEGGIIDKILVKNNTYVKKGEVILKLRSTSYSAKINQLLSQQSSLELDKERLQAFIDRKKQIDNQVINEKNKSYVDHENQILMIQDQAREDQLDVINAQINAQKEEVDRLKNQIEITAKNLDLLNEEVKMYENLAVDGYVSKKDHLKALRARNSGNIELNSLNKQFNQAEQKLLELFQLKESTISTIHEQASKQLDTVRSQLDEIVYKIKDIEDQLNRTVIKAPISGMIKGLSLLEGEVVPSGGQLFSIVPSDSLLQAKVKILPHDIGHIKLGDSVIVKITAFDYARYGSIKGKLITISATTFQDEDKNAYYEGIIALDMQYVNHKKYTIKPGMLVEADIITGDKTILEYLLKPIHTTLSSAFYER
ncbi:HlyD family type I secretion periplasmic adaptor subunit [Thiotrichales bacterium 19S3-7]|nr:HlyD family type I secretion periplasmic adaptor subunit [Thiotrichales bacterium 19S3-7]MCF6802372.1 HlyD family type I secretion periplasmic adaptor subunit [Thiotrichales bacterium 19S3-11]